MLESLGQYYIVAGLMIIPLWGIVRKTGLDRRFALIVLVPYIGWLIVLGLLAFRRWPANRLPEVRRKDQA